jgi:hypothetical protein
MRGRVVSSGRPAAATAFSKFHRTMDRRAFQAIAWLLREAS